MEGRKLAAVGLVIAALAVNAIENSPAPAPSPAPDGAIVLQGLFSGPTALSDARTVQHLSEEIADAIEQDGNKEKPRLAAGVHFDDLRVTAREFRCRGESIGDRQPAVAAAVGKFLEQAVGNSGGPVNAEQRAKWIAAYREIARAASVAP